ncbi:MAG: hypothetical protein IPL51_10040 [Candidatus Competibacteraceae bacterium]|nr:hypothetical protein [Candidatus Competibacteraceae bacterium]
MEGFKLVRGDSISLLVTFDDGGDPPQPIDIGGRTLTFTAKRDYDDPDSAALVQVSVTFPANADSAGGKGWFFVPHTETEDLTIGDEVVCDFQETYTDSRGNLNVTTLEVFKKTVLPDVTRGV